MSILRTMPLVGDWIQLYTDEACTEPVGQPMQVMAVSRAMNTFHLRTPTDIGIRCEMNGTAVGWGYWLPAADFRESGYEPTTIFEGVKHDAEKPRMELLSRAALEQIALVMGFGAGKYTDHNWRKGFAWSRLYGAALRHLLAHMDGEDKDPESGLSHLAHLGCCVMFLLEHEQRNLGTDDRHREVSE